MKYPIGIQSFERIIEDGYVYVDKTALVYDLVSKGKIYFLCRPRPSARASSSPHSKTISSDARNCSADLPSTRLRRSGRSILCSMSTLTARASPRRGSLRIPLKLSWQNVRRNMVRMNLPIPSVTGWHTFSRKPMKRQVGVL